MKSKKKGFIFKQDRYREFKDERHDTYRSEKKFKEPARCPDCGSLFINGRWTWEETGDKCYSSLCPACQRIQDDYPAGFVTLSGPFFEVHQEEIMHLVRNLERAESNEHPLERIMKVLKEDRETLIATTGMHLARRMGNALKQAYDGHLELSYDAENFVRISWQR